MSINLGIAAQIVRLFKQYEETIADADKVRVQFVKSQQTGDDESQDQIKKESDDGFD